VAISGNALRNGSRRVIAVFLSTLFLCWLWGMVGALLAAPIPVAVRVMSRHVNVMAFLRPLLR